MCEVTLLGSPLLWFDIESARFVLHIEEMFINTFGRITYIINKLNDNFFTSEFNDIKTRVRKGKIG